MQIRRRPAGRKPALLILLALALCACTRVGRCAGGVTEVTYHHWTGHVIPPWSEEYVISGTKVRLTRTGSAEDDINAGAWEFDVDSQDVARLFEQLEAVKWASIRAISPDGPAPDGGGARTYQVTCQRNSGGYLSYGEGRTYKNGEAVTAQIEAFIADLALPREAYRYISDINSD